MGDTKRYSRAAKVLFSLTMSLALLFSMTPFAFADTPDSSYGENGALKWSVMAGAEVESDWGPYVDGPTQLVMDDSFIYAFAKSEDKMVKFSKEDGSIVGSCPLAAAPNAYSPEPALVNGVLYMGLTEGKVTAISTEDMTVLWTAQLSTTNSVMSQVHVQNGKVYAGTYHDWGDPDSEAKNYFAILSAADGTIIEEREAQSDLGYYYTEPIVVRGLVVVGSDDHQISCFVEGEEASTVSVYGNIRSAIRGYGEYFYVSTTDAGASGILYKFSISDSGAPVIEDQIDLGAGCTVAPVFREDKMYVSDKAGIVHEIDVTSFTQTRTFDLGQGLPLQGEPVIAEFPEQGRTILYTTYNGDRGGIRGVDLGSGEVFDMFTPPEALQQYCLSDLLYDGDVLYYKNDSGYIMAVQQVVTKDLSGAEVKLGTTSYTYSGSAKKPSVTVTLDGETLVKDTDYTVSYSKNVNAGKAAVTVKGIEPAFTGSKTVNFTIKAKAVKPTVKLGKTKFVYDGKTKMPKVTVTLNGKTLTAGTDYTVKKPDGRKNPGKYTVKVTMKGNYSGSASKSFTIRPKATSLKTVKAASKTAVKVTWNKQATQTSGYQIKIATNSKFTKGTKTVLVKKNGTTSKKIKELKKGTKYYVKIRTYKEVNGTKYWSSWSKYKTVTTKK